MTIFFSELIGTLLLILLGDGVVANVVLRNSKGTGSGWIVITTGWALAVIGKGAWSQVPIYIAGQFIGAFLGAALVFVYNYDQFKSSNNKEDKLAVFCTGPAIRNNLINFICEVVGTFVLVFGILGIEAQNLTNGIGTLFVGLLIWSIGLSLGGTTGYAINPARDLGPRIAHAILPIPNKGDSDWGYAWIPVIAPIVGAVLASTFYTMLF